MHARSAPLPADRLAARDRGAGGARHARGVLLAGAQSTRTPLRALGRAARRGRRDLLPDLGLPALPAVRGRAHARTSRRRRRVPTPGAAFLRIVPGVLARADRLGVWLGLSRRLHRQAGSRSTTASPRSTRPTYALGGLPQAWTLCVEVSFYAFLPLCALADAAAAGARRRRPPATEAGRPRGRSSLVAFAWQLLARLEPRADPDHAGAVQGLLYLPAFLDQFALGMALAVASVPMPTGRGCPPSLAPARPLPGAWAGRWRWRRSASSAPRIGLDGVGGLAEPTTTRAVLRAPLPLRAGRRSGCCCPAVFGEQEHGASCAACSVCAGCSTSGVVSYGIYLWHIGVFVQLGRLGPHARRRGPGAGGRGLVRASACSRRSRSPPPAGG